MDTETPSRREPRQIAPPQDGVDGTMAGASIANPESFPQGSKPSRRSETVKNRHGRAPMRPQGIRVARSLCGILEQRESIPRIVLPDAGVIFAKRYRVAFR